MLNALLDLTALNLRALNLTALNLPALNLTVANGFLAADWLGKPVSLWLVFLAVIVTLLVFDLGVLNRKDHIIRVRESLLLSVFYIAVSVAFGGWVWHAFGAEKGGQYFTGYLIEKTLSLDNVFVMSLIFGYLGIPAMLQHRVLFYGILGVLVLRGLMIGAGTALISQFEWVLYLFGALLIATGAKMLFTGDETPDIAKNPMLRLFRRMMRVTPELHGRHFFARLPDPRTGRITRYATPLFLALVLIESADLIFALDSVPAIFAITTDPYVVYTSNIFAVLGLRALYFALAAIVYRFQYLKYALALILVFIGGKIFAADLLGLEKIPAAVSLGVTAALIATGVFFSLWKTRKDGQGQGWSTIWHRKNAYIMRVRDED